MNRLSLWSLDVAHQRCLEGWTQWTFWGPRDAFGELTVRRLVRRFVASLLHLASPTDGPLILSAGGDPTLQLFSVLTGATLSRFPVESLLLPHVVVAPLAPFAVTKSFKLKAKKEKEAAKAAAKLAAGEAAAAETAESTPPVADSADAAEDGEEDGPRSRKGPHAWKDGVTTGLAIVKLVEVPNRGVLVLAAG